MPASRIVAAAVALLGAAGVSLAADPLDVSVSTTPDPFKFKDGDRVVFLGSTLIERAQKYGYWELALTLKNRDKDVTFRNLGWSGDTVHGEARGRFDYADAAKCFDQMVSLTKELKPTVIVICYGQNESFDGPAGVGKFTTGLEKLIDALAPTKARIVLMSPTRFDVRRPFVNAEARNADLKLYADAIMRVAEKRELGFLHLFALRLENLWVNASDNGLHMDAEGYAATARVFDYKNTLPQSLVTPALEPLRAKIVEKNRLFFYRWRPQNETYLFGFRKKEQGNNGPEVAKFDPLVSAAEKEIAELKKAVK